MFHSPAALLQQHMSKPAAGKTSSDHSPFQFDNIHNASCVSEGTGCLVKCVGTEDQDATSIGCALGTVPLETGRYNWKVRRRRRGGGGGGGGGGRGGWNGHIITILYILYIFNTQYMPLQVIQN